MPTKEEYLAFRQQYEPSPVKLVIVAESPPKSGLYFYNATGRVSEPLFAAMMRHFNIKPASKDDGLREFQRRGWLLVDATYEPVDGLDEKSRNAIILRDYPQLCADLEALVDDDTPIVLIKANVCRLLEHRLIEDGFTIINAGTEVYFPSSGQQGRFREQFEAIFKLLG
jgi:hypothetical protein